MTEVLAWLRRQVWDARHVERPGHDRAGKAALVARLRAELVPLEAALERAAETLQAATSEERDARLALLGREVRNSHDDIMTISAPDPHFLEAARRRLRYATKGRELAGLAFGIARARVNFTAGALFQLERELAEEQSAHSTRVLKMPTRG